MVFGDRAPDLKTAYTQYVHEDIPTILFVPCHLELKESLSVTVGRVASYIEEFTFVGLNLKSIAENFTCNH